MNVYTREPTRQASVGPTEGGRPQRPRSLLQRPRGRHWLPHPARINPCALSPWHVPGRRRRGPTDAGAPDFLGRRRVVGLRRSIAQLGHCVDSVLTLDVDKLYGDRACTVGRGRRWAAHSPSALLGLERVRLGRSPRAPAGRTSLEDGAWRGHPRRRACRNSCRTAYHRRAEARGRRYCFCGLLNQAFALTL